MKIAYVTAVDPHDLKSWSGTSHYIAEALKWQGAEIEYLGPLERRRNLLLKLKKNLYTRLLGMRYLGERDPSIAKGYAEEVARKMRNSKADLILCTHTETLAYYKPPPNLPVVYWTDSTFAGMHEFYEDFCKLPKEIVRRGYDMDRWALERCRLAIYSSEWAAQSAIKDAGADPKKIHIVPLGANIIEERSQAEIRRIIAARPKDVCKLLFLGKVWSRKGGDTAVAVAQELNASGLRTELTLVGSEPPKGTVLPDFVKVTGFIKKSTPEGLKQFNDLFGQAHFLIVPSKAEAYGIVFCEASSFGVPSLTTNVGGIPSVVRDGCNGRTFPVDAPVSAYCELVRGLMKDRAAYEALAMHSFEEYERRLNWRSAGKAVIDLLKTIKRSSA